MRSCLDKYALAVLLHSKCNSKNYKDKKDRYETQFDQLSKACSSTTNNTSISWSTMFFSYFMLYKYQVNVEVACMLCVQNLYCMFPHAFYYFIYVSHFCEPMLTLKLSPFVKSQ